MEAITVYKAVDGSTFDTAFACSTHEATLRPRTVTINRENLDWSIKTLNELIPLSDRDLVSCRDELHTARNLLVNGRHDRT